MPPEERGWHWASSSFVVETWGKTGEYNATKTGDKCFGKNLTHSKRIRFISQATNVMKTVHSASQIVLIMLGVSN
jgi:hypothetical protein